MADTDVRAAVWRRDTLLLLQREGSEGGWSLPRLSDLEDVESIEMRAYRTPWSRSVRRP